MVAFYCATPFHIISTLNIISGLSEKENYDLFILNHFENAEDVVKNLRKLKIFRKVNLINQGNKNLQNKILRIFNIFVKSREIKELSKEKYKKIFFFATDFLNIAYTIKNNNSEEYVFCDDGIGSYMDERIYIPNKKIKKILTLNRQIKYLKKIKSLYLYNPNLVVVNKNFNIIKIQKIEKEKIYNILNIIWNKVISDKKIIIFQQPNKLENGEDSDSFERILIKKLLFIVNKDEILLKLHPRSRNDKCLLEDFKEVILKTEQPFESYMMNMNLENSFLITTFSTAAISPFLFLKKQPYLIFTYKLIFKKNIELVKNMDSFIKKLKEEYDKNRILVPNSIEEIINFIKNNLNRDN